MFVLKQLHIVGSMHAAKASADRLPAELIQQLPIETGIFDTPSISSAKWNSLSALLGLAG
jgi:hypothetical protein